MEESELTRKAIEELMKEMDEYKEKEILPTERKKNPLGRPNKVFLGRTINSIMNHNKRQTDRNLQRCERKLKELDSQKLRREFTKHRKGHDVNLKDFHEISSSDSCNVEFSSKTRRRKKKKRRKKNYRSPSTSSSFTSSNVTSSSSSNLSPKSKTRSRKKIRYKKEIKEDYGEEFRSNYMGFYVDHSMAYAAMAYSEMSRLLHQQQLQIKVDEELSQQRLEIPSDLSISYHSSPESSLNISLHSSSAEEDENGVLTFKLSSDDDEKMSLISQSGNKRICDEESLHSLISLDSKDSEKYALKQTNEIFELSSSDSDVVEIVDTALSNISN